ncbi:acyltransferase family protein [Desertivirga xinjiangensis]|uniref:acyltransferase family protein n=1 Tax=Desertivirga xinjiangensis TaxID=539206 RepID=UPI00210A92CE|nr:acyltransferase [Pedobacter xinjiangensis]
MSLLSENLRFDYLQQWRGIAIILVVLTHTTHHGMSPDIGIQFLDNFIWFGARGVTLFFVLSSFTIFYSIEGKLKSENNNYTNFLIRRFFRIAPLYYLGILIYKFYYFHNPTLDFNLFLNIIFLNWLSPHAIDSSVPGGWSISTEFTFYFFAPLLFIRIKNINSATTVFLASMLISRVCIAILTKVYPAAGGVYYTLNPLCQFPVFILGIMLYFVLIKKEKISLSTTDYLLISTVVLLENLLGFILRDFYLYGIMFSILIYLTSKRPLPTFIGKPLSLIGELSFTIYILHFLIKWTLRDLQIIDPSSNSFISFLIRFLGTLGITVLASIPIYFFLERPMMQWGRILTQKRTKNK